MEQTVRECPRMPDDLEDVRPFDREAGIARLLSVPSSVPLADNAGGSGTGSPDPIFAALAEGRRLLGIYERLADELAQDDDTVETSPEWASAPDAVFAHMRGVVLQTVPTTAAGCSALAAYAAEFSRRSGSDLDEFGPIMLLQIARSPMLTHRGSPT